MKKNRVFSIWLSGAVAALILAGCAAPPQTYYYTLQSPVPPIQDRNSLAVSIGPVTVPEILRQPLIATGGATGRYRLSEYHRWSGEVDRDFARALAEQLAAALDTERVAVFPADQHLTPDRRVLVDVLNMGGDLSGEAVLEVRWTLADPRERVPQIVRRAEFRERPVAGDHRAWVVAQQRNIARLAREIADAAMKGR